MHTPLHGNVPHGAAHIISGAMINENACTKYGYGSGFKLHQPHE